MFTRTVVAAIFAALALAAPAAAQSGPFADCTAYGDRGSAPARSRASTALRSTSTSRCPSSGRRRQPPADRPAARLRQRQARVGVRRRPRRRCRQVPLELPLVRAPRLLRADLHGARLPHADSPSAAYQPPTPRGHVGRRCRAARSRSRAARSRSATRSSSRRWSPTPSRDVDPDRVAVSGGSYGGGESWLQAADPRLGLPALSTRRRRLRLRVAVPKYPLDRPRLRALPPTAGARSATAGRPPTGDGFPIGTAEGELHHAACSRAARQQGIFEEGTRTTPTSRGPDQRSRLEHATWCARAIPTRPRPTRSSRRRAAG